MKRSITIEEGSYRGNNRLLIGIVLSVLSYWLFAQPLLNMAPDVLTDLGISAGVPSGIYKMASSLGGAMGIAISASVYNGLSQSASITTGATVGLLVNVLFCVLAIGSILFVIPKHK